MFVCFQQSFGEGLLLVTRSEGLLAFQQSLEVLPTISSNLLILSAIGTDLIIHLAD